MKDWIKKILRIKTDIRESTGVVYWKNTAYLIYTKNNIIKLSKRDEHFIKNT